MNPLMKIVHVPAWRASLRAWAFAGLALLLAPFAHGATPPDQKSEIVIVPYDSTKPIDGQKPDQFYLPYERFLQLWQAAKEHRAGPAPEIAKFPFALTSARYDGIQGEHSVAFTGKLDVTTTNDEWVQVPLPFKGVKIGGLKIDGATAVFDRDTVVIEKPGRHTLEITFEIPLTPGAKQFGWGIPMTSATLVVLTLPDERTHAVITPGSGVIERVENGRNMVIAAVGSTAKIQVELQASTAASRVTEPAVASIASKLTIRPGAEEASVRFAFSFPGARQDRFRVYVDNGLTLFGLDALNLKSWKLSPNAGRQALDVLLNEPVPEKFSFSIQTQRAAAAPPEDRVAPAFSAAAKRVEYADTAIFSDSRLEVGVKPAPGQRQISSEESGFPDIRPVAAYAGAGKLAYSVQAAAPKREAQVDYAYQVNRRKIELMASFHLSANGDDLSNVTLTLPAQFEVQAVESVALQDWWRDGNALHLRFHGDTSGTIPLVVYLKRQYAAAPIELDVRPLTLEGFKRVTGEAVIAAHKGVDVTMNLAPEAAEMAPAKAAADFQILPPLERKRGFAFKTQNFSAQVALSTLPPRFNALWVMHARAHEGWLALSAHARLTVRQGSIDRASFTLPKSAPEARISGGEVRETRSRVEGDRRIYDVQFQNDVSETVEFTFDFELPDAEEAALPAIAFPEAQMASGYVLTENLSEYEMRLKTANVDPAPTAEIPFLPELSKGAGVFRVQPDWSVSISLDRLEKAESRAAFVAWAEMTSALRADGTEWHRASYRLQNRSLQFLPVRLPEGAELMSARVAGQNVRADTGQVGGRDALLVPLIKTKPGDLSYDVDLVYRMSGPLSGWRVKREFQEPDLPGITVERTLWNVWLPEDRKLETSGGNMEPVLGDLNKTEKLEGKLQEVKQLVTIANSSRSSEDARQNALRNLGVLKKELETDNRDDQFSETNNSTSTGIVPKPTPGDEIVGKKALASQGDYVVSKRKALNEELGRELLKLSEKQTGAPVQQQAIPQNGAQWSMNSAYSGKAAASTPVLPSAGASGNLYLNDNIVLQQSQTSPTQPPANAMRAGGRDTTRAGANYASRQRAGAPAAKDGTEDQKDVILQTARGNNLRREQGGETASPQGLAKDGARNITISGANTYTGATSIAAGTLSVTSGATLSATPAPAAAAPLILNGGITFGVATAGAPQPNPAVDKLEKRASYPTSTAGLLLPAPSADASTPSTRSEAERLQPTGRISLAVDFPTEGQLYHFKKVKASARLDLTVTEPGVFARWWNLAIFLLLGGALYAAGRLFERRSA